jgi:hypothetical protein
MSLYYWISAWRWPTQLLEMGKIGIAHWDGAVSKSLIWLNDLGEMLSLQHLFS